ncbi:MAG: GIY-YIG nuclease family protein [Bacteroidota bacterium]|nr:GIY-YIG nuclease family protein [Bacteroidota bacterium]
MFIVYVLYSKTYDKIYIGFTSNLDERLKSHNELGKGWTKSFRPWIILYTEEYTDKKEALKREMQLKSAAGRLFIRSLINK